MRGNQYTVLWMILFALLFAGSSGYSQSNSGIHIEIGAVQPTGNQYSNGSLTAVVKGGTPPYSFLWSNKSKSSGLNHLPVGQYSITVTDAKKGMANASVVLREAGGKTGEVADRRLKSPAIDTSSGKGKPGKVHLVVSSMRPSIRVLKIRWETKRIISKIINRILRRR